MRKKKHKIILRQLGLSMPMVLLCGTPGKAATDNTPLFTPPPTDKLVTHRAPAPAPYAQRHVPAENPGGTAAVRSVSAARSVPMENPHGVAANTPAAHALSGKQVQTSYHAPLPSAFTKNYLASAGTPSVKPDAPAAVKSAAPPHAKETAQTAPLHTPAAVTAKAVTVQPEHPQHVEQIALDSSGAPILHRPTAAGTKPSILVIHHTAQPAQTITAAAPTQLPNLAAVTLAAAPAAVAVAATTPAPQPTPVPAPKLPATAKTEVALRAPEPVDRKQLEFGRISSSEPVIDTVKSSPAPQTITSSATTGGVAPQECIILPWQLPKAPEAVVATVTPPQEVATKIIALDQKNIELAMVTPSDAVQPAPHNTPQDIPAPTPLPFTAPGNPPPVLLPTQNPADEKPQPNTLSSQDKKIIDTLPPEKPQKVKATEPVHLTHERPNLLESDQEVKKHNGVGIQISVKQPKVDINKLLDNAYDALMSGDQEHAILTYRKVLDSQPSNKLALFGLATTYHRAGMLPEARDLYGKLLSVDPYNFEGLNNYLVLLSDENPEEAITEMDKLEKTHPGFSPIPAQLAIIYEKTGDYQKAAENMNKAINLSPENLKYRYNMAIILDKMGDWPAAAGFYQDLINAADRGEKIAANPEEIQQRLTFILSNKPKG